MSQLTSFDPKSPERFKQGIMNSWERAGWNRGIAQGREEGKHELIVRLLRLKFGEASGAAIERIAAIDDPRRLDEVAERIITAATIDDLGLA
jgi:hypothetical protein